MAIEIRVARPDQLTALTQLLSRNHLSSDGFPGTISNFWLALDGARIVGSIGIEPYGRVGLLRSVCVDADYRNQKIARQLYETACQEAHRQGIQDLYLLTTTADNYFERLGFEHIERTTAPNVIQQTTQFSALCPSSAIVMKQTL